MPRGSLMGRKRSDALDVRFEMRLSQELVDRLAVQARRLGLSDAAYIRMALARQLEQDEKSESSQD